MRQPTDLEKSVARFLVGHFPQHVGMHRYGDDFGNDLYVADIEGAPERDFVTYSTIGLSEYEHFAGDVPVRIELIGMCPVGVENYGNVVASCAFHSITNGNSITYGSCIQGIVDDYNISASLSHVTFVHPFKWDDLARVHIADHDILWLMALPISSKEAQYLSEYGIDALERKLEDAKADITDFERPSVVEQ